MAIDNKLIWKSTIVVALIASIGYTYASSFLIGSWMLFEFPVTLWCVWLGILLSTKIRIPIWIRAIILCLCAFLFFLPKFSVCVGGTVIMCKRLGYLRYILLFVLGFGISPKPKQNHKFVEYIFMAAAFMFLYLFMVLVENRASYVSNTMEAEPVEVLLKISSYGKYLPLATAIWFCGRLALSDKVQMALSKKGVSVTAFVLILALGIYDICRSFISYGHTNISVILTNPAVSIMIILGIEKLVKCGKAKVFGKTNE